MFKVHTTIILGAGASWGYGYPLGHDLVDKVIALCGSTIREIGSGSASGLARRQLHDALRTYDPVSIDAFLWHYKDKEALVNQAKTLIAQIILSSADNSLFNRGANFQGKGESNWYRYLWDAIVNGKTPEELATPDNPFLFNVITFNYDVSLEQYLYSRITSKDSMFNDSQRRLVLDKLSNCIHHVYGAVLNYKWMGGRENDDVYRLEKENDYISNMAYQCFNNILLIGDRSESDYSSLRKIIKESTQVIFLGFGFDDTNIGEKVLHLDETLQPRKTGIAGHEWLPIIKYTNYGNNEIINNKFNVMIRAHEKIGQPGNFSPALVGNRSIIRSSKRVYQALENDFSLHNL